MYIDGFMRIIGLRVVIIVCSYFWIALADNCAL